MHRAGDSSRHFASIQNRSLSVSSHVILKLGLNRRVPPSGHLSHAFFAVSLRSTVLFSLELAIASSR